MALFSVGVQVPMFKIVWQHHAPCQELSQVQRKFARLDLQAFATLCSHCFGKSSRCPFAGFVPTETLHKEPDSTRGVLFAHTFMSPARELVIGSVFHCLVESWLVMSVKVAASFVDANTTNLAGILWAQRWPLGSSSWEQVVRKRARGWRPVW
mmetsp:Transcript_180455/g.572640  ORF Transcript_180455/g.572640 Transcript_180455/m.572640 type:complete len:153 (+) Transcript_180455:108-566(+)